MTAVYEFCVEGQIELAWSDWLEAIELAYVEPDRTVLRTQVVDQAALHGLIARIRDMNLTLVYVQRSEVSGKGDGMLSQS